MRLHAFAIALVLGLGALSSTASADYGYGSGVVVVRQSPPAQRYENVDYRDGYVWVAGNWNWDGYRWSWIDGHYEASRSGYEYVQSNWTNCDDGYSYNPGYWRAVNTEYRTYRPAYRPVVRRNYYYRQNRYNDRHSDHRRYYRRIRAY